MATTTETNVACVTCGGQGTIGDGGYIHCPACAHVWDRIIPLQPATSVEPRLAVARFAEAMEAKLRANDHKPTWRDYERVNPHCDLLDGLRAEVRELVEAVEAWIWRDAPAADVLLEAADVANFALMVADLCGALGVEHDGRGR